jgi:hypothetical protein
MRELHAPGCPNDFVLDMLDYSFSDKTKSEEGKLLDHRPLKLNKNDYELC